MRVGGDPEQDPRFRRVSERLQRGANRLERHPPASAMAAQAQAAAESPPNEREATAQANQVEAMEEAETPPTPTSGFLALLREQIDQVMPETLEDADQFMEGNESEQVRNAVSGGVRQAQEEAAGPTEAATSATPDTSQVPERQATPLPEQPAAEAPAVDGAEAMPAPRPASEVNQLQEVRQDADEQMREARLTPERLRRANDPRFSAVLTARAEVDAQAASAPARYRAAEQATLGEASAQARGRTRAGLRGLEATRNATNSGVRSSQDAARERDEKRRREVAEHIQRLYDKTKSNVEAKLATLETDVLAQFDEGAETALSELRRRSDERIEAYKDERYSGIDGAAQWVADLFGPVPPGIQRILREERERFRAEMDALAVRIATTVDERLAEAKDEVTKGEQAIREYVEGLPQDLQEVGQQAQRDMAGRFERLRSSIDERANSLARQLAERYRAASERADEAIAELEAENEGALHGVVEAIGEVVRILTEFKDKLVALLRKGQETIQLILDDPIGFLGNLLAALKQGFNQFVGNIWAHLRAGFMAWLLGSLAQAGIQPPGDLSLPSILQLVLQVLGITYDRMRAKAVRLLGERNVAMLERLVELVRTLITGGPQALWEQLKEYLGNLKAMVIDALQSWLIETVIKSAVTKIVSMFNPAGAIIQALITIYNTAMFIIERASQIMALVEAVINSVHAIATGSIGGAARWIEQALARAIPVVIGFLARLIGLGGISGKIREIIQRVQGMVDRAIDRVLARIVQVVKRLFGGGRGRAADDRTPAQKERDLDAAVSEGTRLLRDREKSLRAVRRELSAVKRRYRLTRLEYVQDAQTREKERGHIRGEINPAKDGAQVEKQKEKTYLGASKSGNTFEGDFSHADWNWNGYPPVDPVTQHPANAFLRYVTATSVPRPEGHYKVGGGTAGAPEPVTWRAHLDRKKNTYKTQLLAQGVGRGPAENQAKQMVEQEYAQLGFALTWMALNCYAERGKGWQGHHIHPINWGGAATAPSNLIYLHQSQHHPFTTWWDRRKTEILTKLNEPE